MVTSILEGPRLPDVLFFEIFGNLLAGVGVTGVVIGFVVTVVGNNVVLVRASEVAVENNGVVLCGSVVSPGLGSRDVSGPVDSIVCASVPVVVSLVKSFVVPVLLEVSL